jgi:hypothetical protein
MAIRKERLEELQKAVKEYVKEEKTRLENEVKVMEAILKGRTGGAGVQKKSNAVVAAVAQNNLAAYLQRK